MARKNVHKTNGTENTPCRATDAFESKTRIRVTVYRRTIIAIVLIIRVIHGYYSVLFSNINSKSNHCQEKNNKRHAMKT